MTKKIVLTLIIMMSFFFGLTYAYAEEENILESEDKSNEIVAVEQDNQTSAEATVTDSQVTLPADNTAVTNNEDSSATDESNNTESQITNDTSLNESEQLPSQNNGSNNPNDNDEEIITGNQDNNTTVNTDGEVTTEDPNDDTLVDNGDEVTTEDPNDDTIVNTDEDDYNVSFHYLNYKFTMKGGTSFQLSELIRRFNIDLIISEIKSIESSDNTVISIVEDSNDYIIESLNPFYTEEKITIITVDDRIIVIDLTDPAAIPDHDKILVDNGDGTYTLELTITGDADTTSITPPVNVVIVYDVSTSMTGNRIPSETGAYGIEYYNNFDGVSDGTYFQLYKRDGNNYTAITDSENYTGTVYRRTSSGWGYSYSKYTGQRHHASITRADAGEKVVYDFTHALFGYQDETNPSNIQVALVTFSRTASVRTTGTNGWTSTESNITNLVSNTGTSHKLNYTGYTNWEAALYEAYNLVEDADDDPTYVVFITDGQPTESNYNNQHTGTNVTGNAGNDDYRRALNEARLVEQICNEKDGAFYSIYAFGKAADWLASLTYYAYNGNRPANNIEGTTFETTGYYNASDTNTLNLAINDIFDNIVDTLGVSNAIIEDGTTHAVQTSTGSITDLLEVDSDSIQHWLTIPVTTSGNNYKFTMVDKITGNDVEYTATVSGENIIITWNNGAKSATYKGVANTGSIKLLWDEETPFYNIAAPQAEYSSSTGSVDWDLSPAGTLLDGVTYSVTFRVYPSQTTLDYVADIKNNPGEDGAWASLDPEVQKYIDVNGNLKTNTTASLSFVDTRTGEPGSATYTNPDPVETNAVEAITVTKVWDNDIDDRVPDPVTLTVTRDGVDTYTVDLSDDNNWTDNVFVSIGIIDKDGNVLSGAEGHDFTFTEPENFSYRWELDVPVIHPMLINGEITMLIKVDEKHQAPEGADTYVINGSTYYVDESAVALTATNDRRSRLFLTKVVTGENVPEDVIFPFVINVVNSNAPETEPENDPNHDSDYWVWVSIFDAAGNGITQGVTGATHNGGGYWYASSGSNISIPVKVGYSILINNLPTGTTYTITEGTLPTGFKYDQTDLIIEGDGTDTTFSPSRTTTGTIESTNTIYTVQYTNEYTLVDVTVNKYWDDKNDQDGIRPDDLTLTLNGVPEGTTTPDPEITVSSDGNTWTYTWSGLPKYDDEGNTINYTVTEANVPEGYTSTKTTVNDGETITNTHETAVTSVTVNKEWEGNPAQDGKTQPTSVQVILKADGTQVGEAVTLNEENEWTYTWSDLEKFSNGEEITYTVEEVETNLISTEETPGTYHSVVDGSTITNTYITEKTSVTVSKEWEGNPEQDGKSQPTSVQVILKANGTQVGDAITLNEENEWTYTWSDLEKFANGREINYTVEEVETDLISSEETPGTYHSVVDGTTITNTYITEKTSITVNKEWEGDPSQDGKTQPTSVEVILKANGTQVGDAITLNEENEWTYTWSDLEKFSNGREITYTVEEVETNLISTEETPGTYHSVVDGSTITNTYITEKTSVTVNKEWEGTPEQDGKSQPTSVEVILKANGTQVGDAITLNEENEWTYTWSDLEKFANGREITYTVEEVETDLISSEETPGTYHSVVDGSTITNTYITEKTSVTVNKEWEGDPSQDGKTQPTSVEVILKANGTQVGDAITLNEENEWTYTWSDLEKFANGREITYTVEEVETDLISSEETPGTYHSVVDGSTITNTYITEKTSVTVSKEWEGDPSQDGKSQPTSVQVILKANGTQVGEAITLNEENEWTYTWSDLEKFANGREITYTVEEVETDLISSEETPGTYHSVVDGSTITNTYITEKTSVTVNKEWEGDPSQDGKTQPTSVEVILKANGTQVGEAITLNEENEWTYTWSNLEKFSNGEEITYTVEEVETDLISTEETPGTYHSVVDGTTITNTYITEKTSVTVSKEWEGDPSQDGKSQPTSVQVILKANGTQVGEAITLNEENEWTYTWSDLEKFSNGREITYTVEEVETNLISTEETPGTYHSVVDGSTITNTYITEKTSVTVNKEWEGNPAQDGKTQPTSVQVILKANGTQVGEAITLNEENEWTYTWSDLEKFANGREINYTVEEVETDLISSEETPGTYHSVVDGSTITNTYITEKTSVTVNKEWEGTPEQDGKTQPTSVEVILKANGTQVGEAITLNEANEWTYTWSNLEKFSNGEEITYTVEEVETDLISTEETPGTYHSVVDGSTITNTYITEKTSVTVNKEWEGTPEQDGKTQPTSVEVILKANGTQVGEAITLNEANEWTYTWSNLEKFSNGEEITYTVEEVETNLISKEETPGTYHSVVDGTTITNTYITEKTSVTVNKEWEGTPEQDGKTQPTSVEVILKANGTQVGEAITLNEENEWTYTWSDLEKFANGREINYTVEEVETDLISTEETPGTYHSVVDGSTITNTYITEKTSVTVNKEWEGTPEQDGKTQPTSVEVILKANGTQVGEAITLNEENEWTYTWSDLEKFSNGEEITYTVEEVETDLISSEEKEGTYLISIDGYTITNTYISITRDIHVNKVWDDFDNYEDLRPESVTINLYANGELVDSVVLSEENNWEHTWTGVAYNEDGVEIEYTVDENKVEDYDTTISGNAEEGFTVTNTHTGIGDDDSGNPKTGDNIFTYIAMMIIGAFGLLTFSIKFVKNN